MNKRVVLFTTFSDIQKAYSLNIITQSHIKQLLLNDYKPVLIVHETFEPEGIYAHPNIQIEKIPNVPCHNEIKKDKTFDEDVEIIESRLSEILKPNDVVITHDIIYQNACLKHNFAARRIAKKILSIKWLHWIHSATSPHLLNMVRPIFSDEYANLVTVPFPNSLIVYPNDYAIPAVAKNFGVSQDQVRVIHHPTDIAEFFGFPQELERIVYEKDILSADAIAVYPIRLDTGKQAQYVIRTMSRLKDFGLTVKVIIPDFHSTGIEKNEYRDYLKKDAIDWEMNSDEVIFLSEQEEKWKYEVPHDVIRCLQSIANVFIMPSVSETYSLITQEAALCKQVIVLNQDFPPFRSIYGPNAIYKKYSSAFNVFSDVEEAVQKNSWTETKYGEANLPDQARLSAEKAYHRGTAGEIAARLKHPEIALATFLRQKRNLQYVFKNEMEPLFFS